MIKGTYKLSIFAQPGKKNTGVTVKMVVNLPTAIASHQAGMAAHVINVIAGIPGCNILGYTTFYGNL